jgi:nucleotide-binding universal stress UspA family protein
VPDEQPRASFEIVTTDLDLSHPVEGELKREPIPDADAECPHCGGRDWLLIEKRAEPEEPFTRWQALACASCGRADGWGSGGRARPGRGDGDMVPEAEPVPGLPGLPGKPALHDVARAAPFDVVAAGEHSVLRGYSSAQGRLTGVTVLDGGIAVTTQIRLPIEPFTPDQLARQALESELRDPRTHHRRERSGAAEELAFAEAVRRAEAQGAAAEAREVTFECDGRPRTFSLVDAAGRWAAAAFVDGASVTVQGAGAPPAELSLRTL